MCASTMVMNLKDKNNSKDSMEKDKNNNKDSMEKDGIRDIYDCDENPLDYMIEPKGSVDIVDKNYKTTKEDLEHIL